MVKTDFLDIYEELDTINEASGLSNTWYSGYARGLNDISTRTSEDKLADEAKKKAQEEEELLKQQEETKKILAAAKKATTKKRACMYNIRYSTKILQNENYPAVDPETLELVYDMAKKEEITSQAYAILDDLHATTKAASAIKDSTLVRWRGFATINGKSLSVASKKFPEDTPQEECYEAIKQLALTQIRQMAHDCRVFGEPFNCSSKLIIARTPYNGREEKVDTISLK